MSVITNSVYVNGRSTNICEHTVSGGVSHGYGGRVICVIARWWMYDSDSGYVTSGVKRSSSVDNKENTRYIGKFKKRGGYTTRQPEFRVKGYTALLDQSPVV